MVAIVNIDPHPRKSGWHEYSVRINDTELFRCGHFREQPLSSLLLSASLVAREHERMVEAPQGRKG